MSIEMRRFLRDDQGQDLLEFSLLLALVMFAVIGFGGGFQQSLAGVTGAMKSTLAAASDATHWAKMRHFGSSAR